MPGGSPSAVLDASALVALVAKERGHAVIRRVIAAGNSVTTPTGLAEALNSLHRRGYGGSREDVVDDLVELGLRVEPMVEEDALEMAFLLARSAELAERNEEDARKVGGLSLGDAACLAVARRLNAIAVVSDGTWEVLEVPGLKVQPFR